MPTIRQPDCNQPGRHHSAKSSNPRPQGRGVTIWVSKRTRVWFPDAPSPRRSSNLSARTRRNPHQPERPDARPLIFNKLLDRSALADCGLSVGRKSGSARWPLLPLRCETSVLADIYRRNGTLLSRHRPEPRQSWSTSPGTTPRRPRCRPVGRAPGRRASGTWAQSPRCASVPGWPR